MFSLLNQGSLEASSHLLKFIGHPRTRKFHWKADRTGFVPVSATVSDPKDKAKEM